MGDTLFILLPYKFVDWNWYQYLRLAIHDLYLRKRRKYSRLQRLNDSQQRSRTIHSWYYRPNYEHIINESCRFRLIFRVLPMISQKSPESLPTVSLRKYFYKCRVKNCTNILVRIIIIVNFHIIAYVRFLKQRILNLGNG